MAGSFLLLPPCVAARLFSSPSASAKPHFDFCLREVLVRGVAHDARPFVTHLGTLAVQESVWRTVREPEES